jgi:hypothetical protein
MDRVTVFSDDRVIEALKDFIPLAHNVHYTQNRRVEDEPTRFFWLVVNQAGHWRRQGTMGEAGSTTQGFYAFNAAGTTYGAMNNRSVERVLNLIAEAKREFEADPPERIDLGDGPIAPVRPRPPDGGSIARLYSRIDPFPEGAPSQNRFIGRDHLWIAREEVESLARGDFPRTLAARLVRFQLFDNVRGEPDPWSPDQVRLADFSARAERRGDEVFVTVEGRFKMERPRSEEGRGGLPDTGYEGTLTGETRIDPRDARILEMRWLAEGEAWGRGRYTGRPPEGRFPLKIAIVEADDDIARRIPPQGLIWGRGEYFNPRMTVWDRRPE